MRIQMHLAASALVCVACASAQQVGLIVRVVDASGANIKDATVTLILPSGVQRLQSGTAGVFQVPGVVTGASKLRVEAPGFRTYEGPFDPAKGSPAEVRLSPASISDTVVVTAERIEQDEESVPASVTALGSKAVSDSRIQSFSNIHEYVPNMRYSDYAGRGSYGYLTLRGLGNSGSSVEPSSTVFIDGVPITNFQTYTQGLYDVEHIEVMRGPQSTLYGSYAEAGVVNIYARVPSQEVRASVRQEYANFNSYSTTANASGPLVRNKLFFGVAGNIAGSSGRFSNSYTGKGLSEFSDSGRMQLRFAPTERWDVNANVLGQRIDDEGGYVAFPVDNAAYNALPSVLPYRNGSFQISQDTPGYRKNAQNAESVVVTYTAPKAQIISTTSRRDSSSRTLFDYDETPTPIAVASGLYRPHEFYQDLHVQSPGLRDGGFSYVAGFPTTETGNQLPRQSSTSPVRSADRRTTPTACTTTDLTRTRLAATARRRNASSRSGLASPPAFA